MPNPPEPVIVVFSFDYNNKGYTSVDEKIWERYLRYVRNLERCSIALFLSSSLEFDYLRGKDLRYPGVHLVKRATHDKNSTWAELQRIRAWLIKQNYPSEVVLIGQYYHIKRIARQARKIGLNPIIPRNLPKDFAPALPEWEKRIRQQWFLRETLTKIIAFFRGQL